MTQLPPLKESQIQALILEWLMMNKYICWRMNTGATTYSTLSGRTRFIRFGTKGMSDIIGIEKTSGRFMAIEVKRPGHHPTPDQQAFIDLVNEHGGLAFVAHSLGEVITQLT